MVREDLTNSFRLDRKKRRLYYGWVVLTVCLILVTISYGIRFSFGVFFKSLEQDFGWTRAVTSGVFSVYMLVGSLFAVLGGWVADRRGAKVVFVVMAFLAFLGLALTSKAGALWHLFLSYSLLVAMGSGATYAITTSLGTRWFKQQRGLALAIVTSGVGLGSILMAPVASYLIAGYGWRTSYLAIGVIALIVMVPCALLLRKAPTEILDSSEDKSQQAVSLSPPQKSEEFSLVQSLKTRNFLLMISIWFFYAFCLFLVMTHIVPHAIDLGITPVQAASIISISGFANIPSRILMGIVCDRFSRKKTALACALVMAAAMLWLNWSSSLWMLYVFAAAFGAAYGGLAPPTVAIVGDTFGVRHIGTILGVLEIGWVSGAAVGPALAGYIFDTTGTYSLAFWLGVISALIIAVLVLFLKTPAKARNK